MGDTGRHAAPSPGAAEGGGSADRAPGASATAFSATVLVVDDEPSIRLLCRINLELDGHSVREAESLDTARAELETGDVDVVLLDVHLHHERSDVLIEECHAQEPPIPVVLVTGSADVTQDRLTDADAILPKPFELDELLAAVRNLGRSRARAS